MSEKTVKYLVFITSIVLILISGYFFNKNFYWIALLPIIVFGILYFFFNLEKVFWIMVFATPLSVSISEYIGSSFDLSLPTEPLLIILLFLSLVSLVLKNREILFVGEYDIKHHLIYKAIIAYLTWMFLTSITSSMPLVSFKFLLSKLWLILPILLFGVHIFKDTKNVQKFVWLYTIPLIIVVFYTLKQHSIENFSMLAANKASWPFYNDHTIYAAILAMFIPVLLTFSFHKDYSLLYKNLSRVALFIIVLAIIFSYTRGAWLSLIAGFGVFVILKFKIQLKTFLFGLFFAVLFAILILPNVFNSASKNKTQSSDDLGKHVKSISNVSSDASNLERLNRWQCAFAMFYDKPLFGFGPGTYQFQYAPFQRAKDRTIISTNFGDGGNAHSEYFGPLAESGIIGTITFLFIIVSVSVVAIRLYYKLDKGVDKSIILALYVGLVTYWVHGFINNFLDTDKASIPYWGFITVILAYDVKYRILSESKASDFNK